MYLAYSGDPLHDTLDPILLDLVVLFAVCIAVVLLFRRLKMPPIVGFLATGALIGPTSLGLVQNTGLVTHLAEIGVIVLLFTVGMELSLSKLLLMRRAIFVAGTIQVVGTTMLGAGVALLTGLAPGQALFLGFMLTLSSTAAVTKILGDSGEISRPSGRIALSLCVAQDLAVIGMILVVPLLGGEEKPMSETLWQVLRSFGWLAVIAAGAMIVIPRFIGIVARSRSHELFVLAVITMCLALSVATAHIGASLALGAFLAGLVLAGSDYRHQAVSEVEPFRDALGSLFFVSIGMLFDYRFILEDPLLVGLVLMAVIAGKTVIAFVAASFLNVPRWVAIRSALMIAQVGEFSFVLAQVAGQGFLPVRFEKALLVVAVLSIALTPLLFHLGRRLAHRASSVEEKGDGTVSAEKAHVLIIGFGPLGQTLARMFKSLDIPYRVIELNANTVEKFQAQGEPITMGDASRASILNAAGISGARLLILASSDPEACNRTAILARKLAPHLHIIARAIYLGDVPTLQAAGIEEVVPQELETAMEIAARAMRHYLVPDQEVRTQTRHIRDQAYGIAKVAPDNPKRGMELSDLIPDLELEIFRVGAGSEAAGISLGALELRKRTGINLVAVQHGEETLLEPTPELCLHETDIVVAIGSHRAIGRARDVFRERETVEAGGSLANASGSGGSGANGSGSNH